MQNPFRPVLAMLAFALVTISAHAGTLTLSSPASGATVTAPVHVVASASSSSTVTAIKIYLDGSSVYSKSASSIDTTISASSGSHQITVKGWDKTGASFYKTVSVTVSGSGGT